MINISTRFIRRMKTLKTAQAINLAIWAGMNILTGSIFIYHTESYYFYFFAMNISWNIVNTAVAIFLYTHHNDVFKEPISLLKQIDYQRHIEKAVVFNLGLDLAFIATGFAMYYNGNIPKVPHPNLWLGFGISIILQGSFLLLQDIIFYMLHTQNRNSIYPHWQKLLDKF